MVEQLSGITKMQKLTKSDKKQIFGNGFIEEKQGIFVLLATLRGCGGKLLQGYTLLTDGYLISKGYQDLRMACGMPLFLSNVNVNGTFKSNNKLSMPLLGKASLTKQDECMERSLFCFTDKLVVGQAY